MHHFPVVGQPRDVAGAVVDLLLSLYRDVCLGADFQDHGAVRGADVGHGEDFLV
jgi:hypothetical protein